MISSSLCPLSPAFPQSSSIKFTACKKPTNRQNKILIGCAVKPTSSSGSSRSSSLQPGRVLQKSLPLAAAVIVLLSSNPAKAGFLSGFSGLESIPGPKLPEIDFLNRFNEENQKKYAEADARFKTSPLLKEYLERSKSNQEKNRRETQDKYCLRGAEWGVGDCSTEGMSPEEKEKFILMLKQKAGVNE